MSITNLTERKIPAGVQRVVQLEENCMPLRVKCLPIEDPNDEFFKGLASALITTSMSTIGLGISAPQVNHMFNMFVMTIRPTPRRPDLKPMQPVVVINPRILWMSSTYIEGEESCLSIGQAKVKGIVSRPDRIRVEYTTYDKDEGVTTVEEELHGLMARIFLHEYGHLQGELFIDIAKEGSLVSVE